MLDIAQIRAVDVFDYESGAIFDSKGKDRLPVGQGYLEAYFTGRIPPASEIILSQVKTAVFPSGKLPPAR